MLGWFKDSLLTLPIVATTPKWMCVPLAGMTKTTSVWLGDAYTSLLSVAAGSGDTTLFLTQIDEFTTTGTVTIDLEQISYTGVTTSPPSITGCTRGVNSTTAAAHVVNTTVYPQVTYTSSGNFTVLVSGMSTGPNGMSLATPTSLFGPPGVPLLLSVSTIQSGIAGAIQINLQINAPAGAEAEYTNLGVTITPVTRPGDKVDSFVSITLQPIGVIYVEQRDQGLQQRLRLLPANQQVNANLPGFIWGEYRWRDNTTENAQAVVPTRWDTDTSLIQQDFIGGVGSIGETNDLEPIDLEEQQSSIYLRANRGQYFTGVKRYYLPSDDFNLEFLACYPGLPYTYQLLAPPKEQTPVFVGTWGLDSQGFYEYKLNARYTIPSTFEPSSSQPQFMVDRKTGILTVNAAVQQPQTTILLGVLSGGITEYFDTPTYPIDKIDNLYVGNPIVSITNFTFSREEGNITFPKMPGTSKGQPLFAKVDAAIAVLYEYDISDETEVQNTNIPDEQDLLKDTRLLTPDLNPAFSGLSSGYVYLQHRELKPVAVTLSADKPLIPIPPTLDTIIGLVAYGPVFYNGDYALLTGKAIGSLPNEVVPGVALQVVPGGLNQNTGSTLQSYPFRGLINGLDPNIDPVIVTTGGDGIANMVFQPEPNFGYYVPTTSPWVTPSATVAPTGATWSGNIVTLTFALPLSHKFVVNSSVRLSGFTTSALNGDYQITGLSISAGTITVAKAGGGSVTIGSGVAGSLDTLILPVPVSISQLWSGQPAGEGWLAFLYAVLSNDPLFGLTGGSTSAGQIPFATDGTVNGTISITHAAWTGGVATFTLAAAPTNLVIGQNIDIIGCTTSTLNGIQNVLSIIETLGVWYITTPTSTVGISSEAETASFSYSNFRSNGVLSIWDNSLFGWVKSFAYQVGDLVLDSNGNIQQVQVAGTSGTTAPSWTTLFGAVTVDSGVTWSNYGRPGPSTSVPIHALDKNGVDYSAGIFSLTGNAQIVTGTPNVATVQVAQIYGPGLISPADDIFISGASNAALDGTWVVSTATLVGSTWTITFHTTAAPFASTAQTEGTLTDTTFDGDVVELVFNTGLANPSQGFVQAYLFQFLEREIIQLQVVGTNILSNSIMLQMEAPQQLLTNPYLVLSTDNTTTPPFYPSAAINSRFNINRLGITPVVVSAP